MEEYSVSGLKDPQSINDLSRIDIPLFAFVSSKMSEKQTIRSFSKEHGINNILMSLEAETNRSKEQLFDFIDSSIALGKKLNYKITLMCLRTFENTDQALVEELVYNLKTSGMYQGIRPKKMEVVMHAIRGFEPKIYSKKEIIEEIISVMNTFEYRISYRAVDVLLERTDGYIYYYSRNEYIIIDPEVYENEDAWEMMFAEIDSIVVAKKIISASYLKVLVHESFPRSNFEVDSEYFLHNILKERYKGSIITFSRMPILILNFNKDMTIDIYRREAFVNALENETEVSKVIEYMYKNYGFNKLYARNVVSEFTTPENASKQIAVIIDHKEIKWL